MRLRVDQSRGVVVCDEGWSFSLDCLAGVASLELDGLSLRVRPLRWSEKNMLARFSHLGEAFVRQQLVRAGLPDAAGVALDERQQQVVARLVLWLGDQQGGWQAAVPLDRLALAAVTLDVCRATGLRPSDLDGREAAEVEMLWMAARGVAPATDVPGLDGLNPPAPAEFRIVNRAAPPESHGGPSAERARAARGAQAAHDESRLPDDFTRIVIVPDPDVTPHDQDPRDVEAHSRAGAAPVVALGDDDGHAAAATDTSVRTEPFADFDGGRDGGTDGRTDVGTRGAAVAEGNTFGVAGAGEKSASASSSARHSRSAAEAERLRPASRGVAAGSPERAGLRTASDAPPAAGDSAAKAGARSRRRGGRGAARSPAGGSLAQHFRVLAAGTSFEELADAASSERRADLSPPAVVGASNLFAEATAAPHASDAAPHVSTSPVTAAAPRASQTWEAHDALPGERPRAASHATPERRSATSDDRGPGASPFVLLRRGSGADELSPDAGDPAAYAPGGAAVIPPARARASGAASRPDFDGAEFSAGGGFAGLSHVGRGPSGVAFAADDPRAPTRGRTTPPVGRTDAPDAPSSASRERLFEELCERLEEAADQLGID